MAGLEAARRINGLPCTLKQRIWQLEHAEEWGEVVFTYEQVFELSSQSSKFLYITVSATAVRFASVAGAATGASSTI
jgi:hypothetical protein